MTEKLTDGIVKLLPTPPAGARITYDSDVKGFGIRVTAAGVRSFILNYRTQLGRERRFTIGSFPAWKTAAARSEASELRKQIDRGGDPLGEIDARRQAPTVADLCDRFVDEYVPRRRPSTAKEYKAQIEAEIKPALGKLKVAEVTYSDVDALHRGITKRGRVTRANRVIATVSAMFTQAIRWKLRADNPCKGIERNQETKRRRYLSAAELGRLTEALAISGDQQAANVIRLLLLTGARRGETLAARWADIDLAGGVWTKPGATTKTRTDHHVPLSDAAKRLLDSLRESSPEDAEYLFPALDGTPRKEIQQAWRSICRAARIEGARVHDLRHTYASVLASAGLSLPVIGALLGHTTPTTTARYAHLFDDPLRAAANRAADIITGAPKAEVLPLKGGEA